MHALYHECEINNRIVFDDDFHRPVCNSRQHFLIWQLPVSRLVTSYVIKLKILSNLSDNGNDADCVLLVFTARAMLALQALY